MPQQITLTLTPGRPPMRSLHRAGSPSFGHPPEQDIALVRVVKRSIDARQRQVKVNLSLEVYADREPRPAPGAFRLSVGRGGRRW